MLGDGKLLITTWAKKNMPPKAPGVYEVSCMSMPNPHGVPSLAPLTGKDVAVQRWLIAYPVVVEKIAIASAKVRELLKHGQLQEVRLYCFGGRHRSVAVAEMLRLELSLYSVAAVTRHMELDGKEGVS